MTARLNLFGSELGGKFLKHLVSAGKIVTDSSLPTSLQELVSLRVSQINGCAMCIDIHTKHLAAEGEDAVRINLVAAWREATVYTEPERAALELAEQATRIADAAGGVPEDVWANAAKHYTEEELVALTALISLMNAMNRLNVTVQNPAGSYVIGQF
ncbi:carboxymuconolactone decarboxylase family protein [Streptomyces indicus]|uniref:Alkylhydroperoxidase AhpD family core domain-containing protein n=1 Tax=Streptomyces indicus TaxID=417292 RepID=A0A1G9DXH4_9ACTN|nr:carboxymuconolactone decarboxylase family protein [Streptomyces indicus]SDK68519.1 alkylhydroperoxidase AhpD family core domain-containing protein [Streptomyces indicus]